MVKIRNSKESNAFPPKSTLKAKVRDTINAMIIADVNGKRISRLRSFVNLQAQQQAQQQEQQQSQLVHCARSPIPANSAKENPRTGPDNL